VKGPLGDSAGVFQNQRVREHPFLDRENASERVSKKKKKKSAIGKNKVISGYVSKSPKKKERKKRNMLPATTLCIVEEQLNTKGREYSSHTMLVTGQKEDHRRGKK